MAWTYVGSGPAITRGGVNPITNLTVTLPSGVQEGDLILVQLQTFGVNNSPPIPTISTTTGEGRFFFSTEINGNDATNHRLHTCLIKYNLTTQNPVYSFTGTGTTGNNGDSYAARAHAFRPGEGFQVKTTTNTLFKIAQSAATAFITFPSMDTSPTPANNGSVLWLGSGGKSNDIQSNNPQILDSDTLNPPTVGTWEQVFTETTAGSDCSCVCIWSLNFPTNTQGPLIRFADTGQSGFIVSIARYIEEELLPEPARSHGYIL